MCLYGNTCRRRWTGCRSRQSRPKEFCVITIEVLCNDNKRKDLLTELFFTDVILPLLVFQILLSNGPCQANLVLIAYASSDAQSRQNLRCSLIQAMSQEEPSVRKPDPWSLWMAGHAQLKFVMTECSKTQIRLTGLKSACLLDFLW